MAKTVHLHYYAILREQRGLSQETIKTSLQTPLDLYQELREKFGFTLSPELLKVAVNDEFKDWNTLLRDNDTVVFIPPVAGG